MSGPIEVTVDTVGLRIAAEKLGRAPKQVHDAVRRAMNRTGDMTFTRVKRVVAKQMGLRVGVAGEQLVVKRANFDTLRYSIVGSGKFIPTKEFAARQTRKGVSAAPWGIRRVFPHTFIIAKKDGQVFTRETAERGPIKKHWGPALPRELVKGESRKAFEQTVATVFPRRVEHELARLLGT